MTYRAAPISQRDGSALANSNCRMAAISTGIDHHTLGAIASTGAEMRSRQDDQAGGTDSGDAAQAWRTYGQDLRVMDGHTWADLAADLEAGRAVQVDVWHAAAGGPCLSGSGAYGHTLAIAPERNGTDWLVADPWCSPARWTWWPAAQLQAGAEWWGGQVYTAATAGPGRHTERALVRLMQRAGRDLFARYTPDRPAEDWPLATGGSGGRIMYTTTRPQGAPIGGDDVSVNAAAGLTTGYRADCPEGLEFYGDANLAKRLGAFSRASSVWYVGQPIGETVQGGARAILVTTGSAYNDGSSRPTIVYVPADSIAPYSVPPPPPPGDLDQGAIEAARDQVWVDWLLDGAPGQDG
jgi:hypothetical protein